MKKLGVILILFFSSIIFSQSKSFTQEDQQINHYIFNGEWLKADSVINLELAKLPNHPKYYFMKTYNYSYARFFSRQSVPSRDSTMSLITQYANQTIQKGEIYEDQIDAMFYVGSAYGYLARVDVMKREYWDAYWNASKSEDYLENVIEMNPSYYDAYLGLGIIQYWADVSVTGFQAFLVWVGGMSGDRTKGLDYIEKTAKSGKIFKDEAKFVLALAYRARENNPQASLKYYTDLNERFPNNNMFNGQTKQLQLTIALEENGVEILLSQLDELVEKYEITNPAPLNTLGYTLINQNRLEEALTVFKVNVKLFPNVANGYDSLAECYMNLDDNQNAIKYYEIAFDKLDADSTINDAFRERLKESIPEQLEELKSRENV